MATRLKTPKKKPASSPATRSAEKTDTLHVRLPVATIQQLDELAAENSTSRNAIAQITIARLIKTGL